MIYFLKIEFCSENAALRITFEIFNIDTDFVIDSVSCYKLVPLIGGEIFHRNYETGNFVFLTCGNFALNEKGKYRIKIKGKILA